METWQIFWILVYSSLGGLNCLAGTFGFTIFRSTTRYSIFILAILLLFALKRLSKMRLQREPAMLLAAVAVCVAFWDQTPTATTPVSIAEVARVVQSDRDLAQTLEARLPKGAMIFQVPLVDFPESPIPGVSGYDHLRLYINSTHLRFAFGGVKGRPWLQWQQEIAQKTLPEFIQALETYGFAALYINRNGFQDGGQGLFKALADLDYNDALESALGDLVVVFLRPNPNPILPAGKL